MLSAVPLLAHHSVASQFDSAKAMTITGMITRVEWTNPHAWIYMNVKDVDGKIVSWRVQLGSIGALARASFDKNLLNFTVPVTIEVWPAFQDPRDGRAGNGRLLTLADGRAYDVADKWPDAIPVK
jgi:hypothetical protein